MSYAKLGYGNPVGRASDDCHDQGQFGSGVYADTGRTQIALEAAEQAKDLFDRLGLTIRSAQMEDLIQQLSDASGKVVLSTSLTLPDY
jgi:hypothetical protein